MASLWPSEALELGFLHLSVVLALRVTITVVSITRVKNTTKAGISKRGRTVYYYKGQRKSCLDAQPEEGPTCP